VRTSVFADLQGLNVAECYVFVERVFGLHLIVSHYPHERGREKRRKRLTTDVLVPGIIRLGQACIRVADLVFTQRIAEEVESLIDDTGLDYEPNAKVVGRGNVIEPVGFLIKARRVGQSIYDNVLYHI